MSGLSWRGDPHDRAWREEAAPQSVDKGGPDAAILLDEALAFPQLMHQETHSPAAAYAARCAQVRQALSDSGSYWHTPPVIS